MKRALSPEAQKIASGMRDSFLDFIAKRQAAFPTVLRRMAADPWRAVHLLRPAGWLSIKQFRVTDRKFIFVSCRFPDLLASGSRADTAILGTLREFVLARKLGMRFCFNADLYLAAHAILFGAAGVPVDRIVQRWRRFFLQQRDPCYLVLPNDTSPITLLLAKIALECKNMRSVCIQHGLFNVGSDLDDIEGRNSQINLVYDASQKSEMLRRLRDATVEVMGFPANIPVASPRGPGLMQVVLIGTGATEQPAVLAKSAAIFREVARVLGAKHPCIFYRPHPTEIRSKMRIMGELPLDRRSKHELLSGSRKIVVGFNSTLLYEAFLAGHLVIVLHDETIPGYTIRRFGLHVNVAEVGNLARLIADQTGNGERPNNPGEDVQSRFLGAIGRAEGQVNRYLRNDLPTDGHP